MPGDCPKQQEFLRFQKHLLQIYLESCGYDSPAEKNEIAIEFIAKYAADIRRYFCDTYCKGSANCPALNAHYKSINKQLR